MKLTSSRTALAVATVVLLGAAGACGDDDDDDTTSATTVAAVASEAPAATDAPAAATEAPVATEAPADTDGAGTTAEGAAPAAALTIETATNDLGTFLVDSEGRTLYVFMPDDAGPSTCEEDCLAAWPALVTPVTAGAGVDAALLSTSTRPDGADQATYNGWPLYYFAQDSAPGDVNGQGVGDVWYVVDPAGAMIDAD